jgi:transcriptional regulator with XRE-family HTH domain
MTKQQLNQNIAQRLIEARKFKNISKFELALAIKTSSSHILKIENGEQANINFYTIYKICEFLDLDLDYFID